MEVKTKWAYLKEITEDQNNIYLFLRNSRAYIIPKRIFPSPAAKDEFLEMARNYWNLGKQNYNLILNGQNPTEGVWPPAPKLNQHDSN